MVPLTFAPAGAMVPSAEFFSSFSRLYYIGNFVSNFSLELVTAPGILKFGANFEYGLSVVELIVVLFVVFLCSDIRSPMSPLLFFIAEFSIIRISL